MVDFTSLNTATLETATRFHNFAKNIETVHFGNLYTTVIDNIDYYVVECAAKPLLEKAPQWVYENRVVDSIKNNKGLYILVAGIITLFFINYMLHAKDGVQGPGLKPTSPDANGENDPNIKNAGENNRTEQSKDNPLLKSVGSDHEKDRLEEDSDNDVHKSSGKKTNNTSSDNGDKVEDVEAGKKDTSKVKTLKLDEEVHLEEENNSKNTKTANELKNTASGHKGESLEENSNNEAHKSSETKSNSTVNNNGDNVENVEAGEKDTKVETLIIEEEVDVKELSKEEKNIPEKITTDNEHKGSGSDHEKDSL
jgi:hypothetical protein